METSSRETVITEKVRDATNAIKRAIEEDRAKRYDEALKLYDEGVHGLIHCMNTEDMTEKAKLSIRTKCTDYLKRAALISKYLQKKAGSLTAVDGSFRSIPDVLWSRDVAGYDAAKDLLKEMVILPMKFPNLFKGRRPWRHLLLYGPPGCGKSLLLSGLANEIKDQDNFYQISCSQIVSDKYGGAVIEKVFDKAREGTETAVLVIDSLEVLKSSENDEENEIYKQLLAQIDANYHDPSSKLIIIAVTTAPLAIGWNRRKFEKRCYMGPPNETTRASIFRLQLSASKVEFTDEDLKKLAEQSVGYTCADILMVAREALMQPILRIQRATRFKEVKGPDGHDYYEPCANDDPDSVEMTWETLDPEKLLDPKVTAEDVMQSLNSIKASVFEDLEQMEKFTEDFSGCYGESQ